MDQPAPRKTFAEARFQGRSCRHTFAEKAWDMVGKPRSSCASVKLASELPPLLLGCAPRKSDSVPLENPGISPMLCMKRGVQVTLQHCASVEYEDVRKRHKNVPQCIWHVFFPTFLHECRDYES